MIRGLRTLPLRLERSGANAMALATALDGHPKIERVNHPGLTSHPQYELGKKQMTGYSGLFSVLVRAENVSQIESFCNHLKCFVLATSWGGHESLVFPQCAFSESPNYMKSTLPWNLVRFYCGLEESGELIDDVIQALNQV